MQQTYDYIIVGAGSAGCALAHQLVTRSDKTVLLIEAGPTDKNIFVDMPGGVPELLYKKRNNRKYTWHYLSEPFGAGNHQLEIVQGRGLGGSSSVNGMMYILGHEKDFDEWVDMGCDQWRYDQVRASMEVVHQQVFNGSRKTGQPTVPSPDNVAVHGLFIDGAKALGFEFNDNFNDNGLEGVGYVEQNIVSGKRISSARAFLSEIKQATNFTVITDTLVSRVELEGKRATGVSVINRDKKRFIAARKEVIVCAGGYKSPHILQLSGIGAKEDLAKAGIELHHELPAVGHNLQDRFLLPVIFELNEPISLNSRINTIWKRAGVFLRYWLARRGPAATSHFATNLFYRSQPGLERPDIELTLIPMTITRDRDHYAVMKEDGITFNVNLLRSQSNGKVVAQSANPLDSPKIHYDFPNKKDLETLAAGVKTCRQIVATQPWQGIIKQEMLPGDIALNDAQALTSIIFNGYHGAPEQPPT
jgi:choline dehydrogenase